MSKERWPLSLGLKPRVVVAVLLATLMLSFPTADAYQQQPGQADAAELALIAGDIETNGFAHLALGLGGTQPVAAAATLPASVEVVASMTSTASLIVKVTSIDDVVDLRGNSLVLSTTRSPAAAFSLQETAQLNVVRPVIGAEQMHQVGIRGQGQVIAVLDSGIEASHPDLSKSIVFERCHIVVGGSTCPDGSELQVGPGSAADDDGHGTSVAGMLTSDGLIAPLGIAPDVQLEVYRVGGLAGVDLADVLLTLDYILTNRPNVQIINVSVASNQLFSGPCPRSLWPAFFDIVTALQARGTIVVAPTGNQSATGLSAFPACLPPVVAVTGTTFLNTLQPAANIDSTTDIAAPGQSILSTSLGQSAALTSGTSFAVPVVAACAALAMQADGVTAVQSLDRLRAGPLRSGRAGFSVPWINCAPRCDGKTVTVNLALGQQPTSGDDVILGTNFADEILAGRGNDTICSLDGNDFIVAGFGDDIVFAGKGDDVLYGGGGADRMNGQIGHDVVHGGDGDDALYGSWGHDVIYGEAGNDFISGKAGRDVIDGGQGDDRIYAGLGSDIVIGGPGDDLLSLAKGGDTAYGNDGNDVLLGDGGWDWLDGGAGTDDCQGGSGYDQALSCETTGSIP